MLSSGNGGAIPWKVSAPLTKKPVTREMIPAATL
jgi:hypothetical protein